MDIGKSDGNKGKTDKDRWIKKSVKHIREERKFGWKNWGKQIS